MEKQHRNIIAARRVLAVAVLAALPAVALTPAAAPSLPDVEHEILLIDYREAIALRGLNEAQRADISGKFEELRALARLRSAFHNM